MTRADDLTVAEIAQRLAAQAQAVARALLPSGHLEGGGQFWSAGDTAGNKGQSLKVNLTGARRGQWKDFASNEFGDLIDLIMATQGLDKGAAVQWAKAYLGLEHRSTPRSPEERAADRARREREAAEREALDQAAAAADRALKQADAIQIWRASNKFPDPSSPADHYLRGRGVLGPLPPTLRHNRRLWHGKSQRFLPGLVACVQGPDEPDEKGRMRAPIIGVHRHWLDPNRPDKRRATDKFSLGPILGGCTRLTKAASRLILCEGVETGLSLKQSQTAAVWCGLTVGGMVRAWIPDEVTELVIACDGDSVGSSAWLEARIRAVRAHERPGRIIRVKEPPQGMDFNDIAQLLAVGGLR